MESKNFKRWFLTTIMDVLELGAGMGRHSGVILDTGANLTVNDISPSSLNVLKRTYPDIKKYCGFKYGSGTY